MKIRRLSLATVTVTVAVCLAACVGVALAASATSPTVSTGSATGVADTTAVLAATVTPNGSGTTYIFQFGPTSALGSQSAGASAGSGTTGVVVQSTISGLIPGTIYFYRVEASNKYGSTTGATKTFKTTGNPPPEAATGAPQSLTTNSVTLTGTVYPQGQTTTYYFRYGLTTAYGLQTAAGTVPAGTAPVAVATTVPGLDPGATFHFQLVAVHANASPSAGADGSFETFPSPAPQPEVQASTSPRRIRGRPYMFRTEGRIVNPSTATPAPLACVGSVEISLAQGRTTVAQVAAPIQPDCTYAGTLGVSRLPGHGRRGRVVKLRVFVHFTGNDYLASAFAPKTTVTLS